MAGDPDFDEQDSGAPVTSPQRNPDPLDPQHSSEPGAGGGSAQGGDDPADVAGADRAGQAAKGDEEPGRGAEGGPAVPDREGGLDESNPAEGL